MRESNTSVIVSLLEGGNGTPEKSKQINCKQTADLKIVNKKMTTTDLGSQIGNYDCGYFTVWKFSNFPATQILREIKFG